MVSLVNSSEPHGRRRAPGYYARAFAVAAAAFVLAGAWQLLAPLRLNGPGADLWQHLAAISAIIEDPASPANPLVPTDDPSRLFGPYWVAVGALARLFGASALQALIAASVVNLLLWTGAVLMFGRAYFGSSKGAFFLLLALILGWIAPPSFTGYYSPLAIITGAAYPAFLLLGLTLMLWALSIRLLDRGKGAVLIGLIVAFAAATHPFGAAIAVAGSAAFALFAADAPRANRARLAFALAAGAILALMWPYYSLAAVLRSASSPGWTTSADFYAPIWLFQSLVPAIFGLAGLMNRRALPLAALLALCAAGFAIGAAPSFAAGHRLLPYAALILHIGLAGLVLDSWRSPQWRLPIVVTAILLSAAQFHWTATIVSRIRSDIQRDGSQLDAARLLINGIPERAGIAGHDQASFPIVAAGRRMLSTPFAEPLVPDMARRQADSRALFDSSRSRDERNAIATRRGVAYLVADARTAPEPVLAMLRSESICWRRAGNLVLFQIADAAAEGSTGCSKRPPDHVPLGGKAR